MSNDIIVAQIDLSNVGLGHRLLTDSMGVIADTSLSRSACALVDVELNTLHLLRNKRQ